MNKIPIYLLAFVIGCSSEPAITDGVPEEQIGIKITDVLESNPQVRIGPVMTTQLDRPISCTGRIEIPPSEFISVHSRSKGFIDEIFFLPGDHVQAGTRLFTISDPDLIQKQRLFAETKAELDQVRNEYDRQQILHESEATSGRALEEIVAKHRLLTARYKGLLKELQMIGVNTQAIIDSNEFQSRVGIFAEQSGYIHEVMVNKGQLIMPENVLLEMANDDHIHLELNVLSKDAAELQLDQEVTFKIAQDRTTYKAKVVKVNRMLDEHTGTLKVHCHIQEDHLEKIKVGMIAQAEIATRPEEVRGLPIDAVIKEGDTYFGYIVKDNSLQKVPLENVMVLGDFISFDASTDKDMVTKGAYYIE